MSIESYKIELSNRVLVVLESTSSETSRVKSSLISHGASEVTENVLSMKVAERRDIEEVVRIIGDAIDEGETAVIVRADKDQLSGRIVTNRTEVPGSGIRPE